MNPQVLGPANVSRALQQATTLTRPYRNLFAIPLKFFKVRPQSRSYADYRFPPAPSFDAQNAGSRRFQRRFDPYQNNQDYQDNRDNVPARQDIEPYSDWPELSPVLARALKADVDHPVNRAIDAEFVHVIDSKDAIHRGQYLKDVIARTDPNHDLVQRVAFENGIPLVKIVTVETVIARYEAGKTKKRRTKAEGKQLELNWAMDGKDLAHKCNKLKEFLSQARRVEVLLAPKKKGRRASPEEMFNAVKALRDAADSIPTAREAREPEGEIGGLLRMTFDNDVLVESTDASEPVVTEPGEEPKQTEPSDKRERKRLEREEKRRKNEQKARVAQELAQARLEKAKAEGILVEQMTGKSSVGT